MKGEHGVKIKHLLAPVLLALMLAGCGPTYQTVYDYTPPGSAQGRTCVAQCQVSQTHCRTACAATTEACRARVKLEARQEYERYIQRETKAGREARRTVNSFEPAFACSDSSCRQQCDGDFRVCYGNCGGSVRATTLCTSGCDK